MKNLFVAALAASTLAVVALPSFAASTIAGVRAATALQQTGAYGGDGN